MRFLYPIDTAESVREEYTNASAARSRMLSGQITQWSSNSTSVTRNITSVAELDDHIQDCIEFLQIYDAEVRRKNPYSNRSRPYMG